MPLQLLLGPANTRKVGQLLDAHATAARAGRDAWLVVPRADDVLRTQRELAGSAPLPGIGARAPAPFGQVMAAPQLLTALLRRTEGVVRLLTPQQRSLLALAAVRRVRPQALEPAARAGWLAGELVTLADELTVTGDLERGDPGQALRTWGARTRDPRGRELADLLTADEALRRRAARGPAAALDTATAAVKVAERLAAGDGNPAALHVALSGFDDLDPVQLLLVTALVRAGADVRLSLPFAEDRVALAGARGLVEELRRLATSIDEAPVEPLPVAAPALARVARGLYEPAPGALGAPAAVADTSVLELRGGGRDEEDVLIAEHVAAAIDGGTPPHAIAIVTAEPGRHGGALIGALRRIGIAAHLADAVKASRHPSVAAALALLSAASDHGTASDLATWLAGPGGPDPQQRLDAELRRRDARRVSDALHLWRRLGHDEITELRELRAAAGSAPAALAEALRRRTAALVASTGPGIGPGVERDLRAGGRVIAVLDELAALVASVPEAAPTLDELRSELERLSVPAEPEPAGSVAIVGPLGVRTRTLQLVVIARAQRGSFPRQESMRRLLAPADRGALTELGWPRPRRPEHESAERYLAYEVVARPTEQLVLAWHESDGDGGPCERSPLLRAVTRAAGGSLTARTMAVGEAGWRGLPAARAAALAAALRGPRHRERTHERCEALAARVHDRYAVGALQKAARCPAMWFVEQELRPDELTPDAAPLSAGRLRHELLHDVIAAVRDAGIPLAPQALPALQQALREAATARAERAAQSRLGETLGEALQRQRVVAEIEATLPSLCGSSTLRHQPHRLEIAFGTVPRSGQEDAPPSESDAPVSVTRAGHTLPLAGRIDRLDRSADGELVVVDYKGARVERYRGAGWVESKELQAGLYALAAEQLAEPGDRAVASLYQPVPGPPQTPARGASSTSLADRFALGRGDALDQGDWDALLDDLMRLAAGARERIDDGVVRADAQGCGGTCRYPWLCRSLTIDDDDE